VHIKSDFLIEGQEKQSCPSLRFSVNLFTFK